MIGKKMRGEPKQNQQPHAHRRRNKMMERRELPCSEEYQKKRKAVFKLALSNYKRQLRTNTTDIDPTDDLIIPPSDAPACIPRRRTRRIGRRKGDGQRSTGAHKANNPSDYVISDESSIGSYTVSSDEDDNCNESQPSSRKVKDPTISAYDSDSSSDDEAFIDMIRKHPHLMAARL